MQFTHLAILVATSASLALAQFTTPNGWYYTDTVCGSGSTDVYPTNFRDGVMTFNQYQSAKSVRMKDKSFSIYTDEGCTQGKQSNGPGGCARLGGAKVRCIKI